MFGLLGFGGQHMVMLLPLVAAVAATTVPEPPSGWEWDEETTICALRQKPSPGSATIEMKRTPGNEQTELLITLPPKTKIRDGRFQDGNVTLQPGGVSVTGPAGMSTWRNAHGGPRLYASIYDPSFMMKLKNAADVQISEPKAGSFEFAMTSASDVVGALQTCEDSKMRAWGIDPQSWRALRERPQPLGDPRNGFTGDDYPREALAQHVEDDAIIRLDVSPEGTVTGCTQLNAGSYRGFEQAACRVLERGRFEPARDSNGQPVSAPIVYDIVFKLPG
jgi:TonB family protein